MAEDKIGRRRAGGRLEKLGLPQLSGFTELEPEEYEDESGGRYVRVRGVRQDQLEQGAVPEYIDDAAFSWEEFESYYDVGELDLDVP